MEYTVESALRKQKNNIPFKTPFVLGAMIELGNCLNPVDRDALKILRQEHQALAEPMSTAGQNMPPNALDYRALDCVVFQYVHYSDEIEGLPQYAIVHCAFSEGGAAFDGSESSSRLYIQASVLNPSCIKGYLSPRPLAQFNPFLEG